MGPDRIQIDRKGTVPPVKRWRPGDVIHVEEYWHDRLWAARPVNVVADDGDTLVLWSPRDSRWAVAGTPPGRQAPRRRADWYRDLLERGDWVLTEAVWRTPMRWIVPRDAWHAVWIADDADAPWHWYVNFQEPFCRRPRAILATDLMLDIVVDAQRRWEWKDEPEFATLETAGLIGAATARSVRADATAVIRAIETGAAPFDSRSAWAPDPDWPAPELEPLSELSRRRRTTAAD